MPINADSVTVELIAKTDGYTAKVNDAARQTEAAMGKVSGSVGRAENAINMSAARIANGQRNLGRQFADVGASLSSGSSPFVVLSQQLPQIADALTDTGGKAARFASILTGPVGAAGLAVASILATTLLPKLLETGEGVDKLVDKLRDNATKTALAEEAARIFAGTQAGLASRIRDTTKALNDQNSSLRTNAELQNVRARSQLADAQNQEKAAQDRLAAARRNASQSFAQGGTRGEVASQRAIEQSRKNTKELADAEKAAGEASKNVVRSRIFLAAQQAAANATATGRITAQYDEQINAAQRYGIAQANMGKDVSAAVFKRIAALQKEKEAALDAARTTESAGKTATRQLQTATRTLADLKKLAGSASGAERDRLNKRIATQEKRVGLLKAGVSSGAVAAATAAGPKGTSAETLAKRAEAARIREVRDNEAYQRDLEGINGQIIAAQRERAITAEDAARFEREAIETEFRKRADAIAADLDAKKYTAAQAAELNERNEYAKALKLRNVAINEDVRTLQDLARQDSTTINILQEQAQAQLSIAETQDERKRIELELIQLKYQERREQLEYIRAQAQIRGDLQAQNNAQDQLDALPGLRRAETTGVEQRNRSRYEQYRRGIDSADALADSIDNIKIQTLDHVADSLATATKNALGLKGALGDIVGQLIKIGIQRAIIGPLADSLFGKADGGGTGGAIGGFLSSIFKSGATPGRASGGNVMAGKIYKINESGPELFQPAQSGKIYPTGSLAAKAGGGNMTVVQHISVDGRNSVTPAGFAQDILSRANGFAQSAAAQAGRAAYANSPSRSARLASLGT